MNIKNFMANKIIEPLFRPLVAHLAFESTLTEIEAMTSIDPSIRKASKTLKRCQRGAFIYHVKSYISMGYSNMDATSIALEMVKYGRSDTLKAIEKVLTNR